MASGRRFAIADRLMIRFYPSQNGTLKASLPGEPGFLQLLRDPLEPCSSCRRAEPESDQDSEGASFSTKQSLRDSVSAQFLPNSRRTGQFWSDPYGRFASSAGLSGYASTLNNERQIQTDLKAVSIAGALVSFGLALFSGRIRLLCLRPCFLLWRSVRASRSYFAEAFWSHTLFWLRHYRTALDYGLQGAFNPRVKRFGALISLGSRRLSPGFVLMLSSVPLLRQMMVFTYRAAGRLRSLSPSPKFARFTTTPSLWIPASSKARTGGMLVLPYWRCLFSLTQPHETV